MKILHIINSLEIAGAERLMTSLLPLMSEQGHQTELLVLNQKRTPFYELLLKKGITIHTLHYSHGKYNPLVIFELRKYLKNYDLVHVHLFPAQYWAAISKWLFCIKTPLVTTEHNTTNTRFNYRLTTWTDRWAYRRYACIICISEAVNQAMAQQVSGQVPTLTINNGIDIDLFAMAKPFPHSYFSIPDNAYILMQVARFQPQKNQDCLIRALERLPENVYAIFVGNGERMDLCKSLAEKIGVAGRTRFLGIREDIPQLWASANIAVMSSHWEGFGLSILEAMAAGIPAVATKVEGLSQVIGNEELCFPDDDDRQLALLIQRLINDADHRQEVAAYCRKRASLFSIRKMADAYIEEYKHILLKDRE